MPQPKPSENPKTRSVLVGEPLIRVIELAYRANVPFLLRGPHGIGKSQILMEAASRLGIGCVVFDLSIMEPIDLMGLPWRDEAGTHYAPPASLPREGKGLLVLEELNRSPRYMMAPCLQLLTARRLNDYILPAGWLPVASINPSGGNYSTELIDPALLSRFTVVDVKASNREWLRWARREKVHENVIDFVEAQGDLFESTNPRSWEYVSNIERAISESPAKVSEATRLTLISGHVGIHLAIEYVDFKKTGSPLQPWMILIGVFGNRMELWLAEKRTDLIEASVFRLREYVEEKGWRLNPAEARNLSEFRASLPGDLAAQLDHPLGKPSDASE